MGNRQMNGKAFNSSELSGYSEKWRRNNIYSGIIDLIGNTPIVMLNREFKGKRVFGKLEYFNPSSSIKDRTAHYIISQAEKTGKLREGGTIIESSSGNFGLALSYIGLLKNYRVVCVADPRMQEYFLKLYSMLEAEVVMVEQMEDGSYQNARIRVANELSAGIENSFRPDQYDCPDNKEAHYFHTGGEIVRQMAEIGLDYLVVGVSTGGTISGCGMRVKEEFPDCKVIAVDSVGSALFGSKPQKRFMTGLGSNYIPKNLDYGICDEVILVNDKEAFEMTRALVKSEFIFAGPSSGAVAVAIRKIAEREAHRNPVILGIFADSGERYMNTVYDEQWFAKNIGGESENE